MYSLITYDNALELLAFFSKLYDAEKAIGHGITSQLSCSRVLQPIDIESEVQDHQYYLSVQTINIASFPCILTKKNFFFKNSLCKHFTNIMQIYLFHLHSNLLVKLLVEETKQLIETILVKLSINQNVSITKRVSLSALFIIPQLHIE